MGAGGEDILLSQVARRSLPLSIECKCVERLNVWQSLEQASSNAASAHETPCLVFARNRSEAYAVLPWEHVLQLYKGGKHCDDVDRLRLLAQEMCTILNHSEERDAKHAGVDETPL
jgi:hypothetical protein